MEMEMAVNYLLALVSGDCFYVFGMLFYYF